MRSILQHIKARIPIGSIWRHTGDTPEAVYKVINYVPDNADPNFLVEIEYSNPPVYNKHRTTYYVNHFGSHLIRKN